MLRMSHLKPKLDRLSSRLHYKISNQMSKQLPFVNGRNILIITSPQTIISYNFVIMWTLAKQ